MRNRTVGINIRVTENEKKKLSRNARRSNLSLSEYLRKLGTEQEVQGLPRQKFYDAIQALSRTNRLYTPDIYCHYDDIR